MKRLSLFVLGTLLGLVLMVLAFVVAVLSLLRPAPGDWTRSVHLGRWHADVSVPAALRMATHPVVLRLAQDRVFSTRHGAMSVQAADQPDTWIFRCGSCRIPLSDHAGDVLTLSPVTLSAHRIGQSEWRGDVELGDAAFAVRGKFKASLNPGGADLRFTLPDTPIAHVVRLFADDIQEVLRAQIDGRMRLTAQLRLPQRELRIDPFLDGFAVSGLGTETLLNTAQACPAPARGFGTWMPRAVVAAEDQRFFEHTGYDLKEIAAALSGGGAADKARGASTLSQQLAKLIYTGDSRTHVRKIRELLYAVELDRTLGKARVLDLYLRIAPWGDGQCGAASAARHYLRKRVDRLTPTEAAWLASMLHHPDRDWAAYSQRGEVDTARVAWVIANLRPMPSSKRASLIDSLPGWKPAPQ